MAVCANCGKTIEYEEKYCNDCLDYLVATNKMAFENKWKYKYSGGGCIGCRYISLGGKECEECTRSHQPAPPFKDRYVKG